MALIRSFFAIQVAPAVVSRVSHVTDLLKERFPNQKWVKPENYHLTLQFLGNVDSGDLPAMVEKVALNVSGSRFLDLTASGYGFFPENWRRRGAKVMWVGVVSRGLADLQTRIAAASGITTPEEFHPHLTLARLTLDRRESQCLAETCATIPFDFGSWISSSVSLIRSEPGLGGSRYSVLAEIPLDAGDR